MNPSASAYVPSSAIAGALARRRATPPATPPIPHQTPPMLASSSTNQSAVSPATPASVPMTAAERLRSSKLAAPAVAMVKGSAPMSSSKASASSSIRGSALQTPVLSATAAPRTHGSTASVSHAALTAVAASVAPSHASTVIRYSKQQLLSLRPAAMERVARGCIVDHPPFLKVPESFAHLLELPHALEYLDVEAATQLVEHRTYASPLLSSSGVARYTTSTTEHNGSASTDEEVDETHARQYMCAVCAAGGPVPCLAIQRIVQRASKYVLSNKVGAALMQPPLVVESLLCLALVFEAKQSSMRLRMLAERSPRVVHLVEEYLCGEGYHLPLPSVTSHDDWAVLNGMLKFDAIRDNKTRVITDLSKHWKKRRTQFEQFVHFFAFRDARPVRPAKNIITQSVKPGMVAMLTGDITAMLLLHRLGFFIPPDYYWSVFPFLRQAHGDGTLAYDVVRHLGVYFSSAQPADMYNPVERPPHAA